MHPQAGVLLTPIQSTGSLELPPPDPGSGKRLCSQSTLKVRKRLPLELASNQLPPKDPLIRKRLHFTSHFGIYPQIKPPTSDEVGRNLRLIRAVFLQKSRKKSDKSKSEHLIELNKTGCALQLMTTQPSISLVDDPV